MRISENVVVCHAWAMAETAPPSPVEDVELPATMRAAVRAEFSRAFHTPYETPIVIVVNGLLMTGLWFGLPVGLQDSMFRFHGALAFPMVLASWMISDVPATNVLGPDRRRVSAVLDDPDQLRRLLYAKNIVLWAVVAPLCAVVAFGVGIFTDRWPPTATTMAWILIVPMGALGVSNWVGIRFPYHPQPLRWRWEHRRDWKRVLVRWFGLALVPYGLVPALAGLIMAPSLLMWAVVNDEGLTGRVGDAVFLAGVVLSSVLSVAMFFGGHRAGQALVRRRREPLRTYLADPELG